MDQLRRITARRLGATIEVADDIGRRRRGRSGAGRGHLGLP